MTRRAVQDFVKGVMAGGEIPHAAMEATLVLIPKESYTTTIHGFRPLSLCNVPVKVISKVIINRLKDVLKKLISPC